jgi:peptidoglycan/xylan/chitin deacetylase (PgdA/CDA1 family)/glycosyltransferase involved in cell wall biosynthesis
MKKILIISYFFPPSTFTGSFRIYSWAKYLNQFGYYPVIVTRKWDIPISDYKDMSVSSSDNIIHERSDNFEVYYLPYIGNLRDKLYEKYGDTKFVLPRRILTFIEVLLQNFTTRFLPFNNLYTFSEQLIRKDHEILGLITSGKPYVLFHFCYILARKYHIPWIADYRDDWNTSVWLTNLPFKDIWINRLEKRSEKKWLSNASCFTSVSNNYVEKISNFIGKKGKVLMNGFDADDYSQLEKNTSPEKFVILFNGTMYDSQPVEIFIAGLKSFVGSIENISRIKLQFLGLNFEKKQVIRIRQLLTGYESLLEITDRVDKISALKIMSEASVFMMYAHNNVKGVTSSKIFDYLAIGKPIILCPSDNEILQEIITSTRSGYICNTPEEVEEILKSLYSEYILSGSTHYCANKDLIEPYSRKNQTEILSHVIEDIFSGKLKNESLKVEKSAIRKYTFNLLNNFLLRNVLRKINDSKEIIRLLCFHNISDTSDLSYPSLKPEHFYDLISYLSKEYDIVPMSEIRNLPGEVKRPLILTFDDGYSNFIQYALPILKEFNVASINNIIVECVDSGKPFWTLRLNFDLSYIYRNHRKFSFKWNDIHFENELKFASPQKASLQVYKKLLSIDDNSRELFLKSLENDFEIIHPDNWGIMNWDEILYCAANGVEIGSHTMTHNSLKTIAEESILRYEIMDSKRKIEEHINKPTNTLAFPNGIYDERCIDMAIKGGYEYLLTTDERFFKKSISGKGSTFILPRISINSNDYNENVLRIENFHKFFR